MAGQESRSEYEQTETATMYADMTGEATGLDALEAVIANAEIDGLNEPETDDLVAPARAALAAVAELVRVLRDIEWSATVDVSTGGYQPGCPVCGNGRDDDGEYPGGHLSHCQLVAALVPFT